MRGDQIIRQWKLLNLIGSRGGPSIPELASELAVSTRTIRRDLEALQYAGFPLFNDRKEAKLGWFFVDGYRLPKMELSQPELMSLYLSRHVFGVLSETPYGKLVKEALHRLSSTLSPQVLRYLEQIEESLFSRPSPSSRDTGAIRFLPVIQRSILDRNRLKLRYFSMELNRLTSRKVDPYRIYYTRGTLYLIAYCHTRKEVRLFALDRVRGVKTLKEEFQITPGFSVEKYVEDSFGVMRGERRRVKVLFDQDVARWVKAKKWHPSERLKDLKDGSVEFSARVGGLDEIKSWVLSFGKHALVLEPEELQAELAREIQALSEQYRRARK